MKLVNTTNQGVVEVSEELALRLLDGGGYAELAKPAPKRRTKKSAEKAEETE